MRSALVRSTASRMVCDSRLSAPHSSGYPRHARKIASNMVQHRTMARRRQVIARRWVFPAESERNLLTAQANRALLLLDAARSAGLPRCLAETIDAASDLIGGDNCADAGRPSGYDDVAWFELHGSRQCPPPARPIQLGPHPASTPVTASQMRPAPGCHPPFIQCSGATGAN